MSRQVTPPRPPPRLRDLTYIDYDIYEHPNIPAGHPHFGRNGAWCRRNLRRELQILGWTLDDQYSMVSRFVSNDRGLLQVRQLQTNPNLYWMPYGVRQIPILESPSKWSDIEDEEERNKAFKAFYLEKRQRELILSPSINKDKEEDEEEEEEEEEPTASSSKKNIGKKKKKKKNNKK
ncbi:hypothetical protein RhiirA1_449808 [Rhizophagus irregularis]|uniref:Uncharacterized protein n=1 Tax=Rhizophagus irregularis TaxID=588596 RepID=A0A2N0SGC5_9GLOM|nr:hypothetical protein RhiirA1_449808 [Rhizophagus irregularis]